MSYIIPIGPYHPALEEPVHAKLYTEGEVIKEAEVFVGYNHRGIEKLATERNAIQTLVLVERVCGICSHSHAFTYAMAVETINGVDVPKRGQDIRVITAELALDDMELFYSLFALELNEGPWELLRRFRVDRARGDGQLLELTGALEGADSPQAMLEGLCAFYRDRGVGLLGLGQVFRAEERAGGARLFPVEDRPDVRLNDLVGYEKQKEQLRNNTLAFLKGGRGNNVLLYGDAGTGKSTSIQAIVNEYAPEGLRLIEVYKDQYELIPDILRQVKGRNYRFILFLDDLSFEENETAYKYLKAVMEGGAEAAPENVRIYATSNRRHLVREMWNDRTDMEHDGDIHRSDTMEEKLSLASRFGLQIFYPAPTFEEYQGLVSALALRGGAGSKLTPAQLRAAAATWQVRSGSRSGRTARQFIDALDT